MVHLERVVGAGAHSCDGTHSLFIFKSFSLGEKNNIFIQSPKGGKTHADDTNTFVCYPILEVV